MVVAVTRGMRGIGFPPLFGNSVAVTPMEIALAEARAAATRGEVPVGAVVLDGTGAVLARAGNEVEARHDPTAHAEMLALRAAAAARGETRLPDCDLVVTLEPCPMCAQAASLFRVRRLVFGGTIRRAGAWSMARGCSMPRRACTGRRWWAECARARQRRCFRHFSRRDGSKGAAASWYRETAASK